jgi:hypothetical protein
MKEPSRKQPERQVAKKTAYQMSEQFSDHLGNQEVTCNVLLIDDEDSFLSFLSPHFHASPP